MTVAGHRMHTDTSCISAEISMWWENHGKALIYFGKQGAHKSVAVRRSGSVQVFKAWRLLFSSIPRKKLVPSFCARVSRAPWEPSSFNKTRLWRAPWERFFPLAESISMLLSAVKKVGKGIATAASSTAASCSSSTSERHKPKFIVPRSKKRRALKILFHLALLLGLHFPPNIQAMASYLLACMQMARLNLKVQICLPHVFSHDNE